MSNELTNRALSFLVSIGIRSKLELKDAIESGILSPSANKDMGIKLFKELCIYCGLSELYRELKQNSFMNKDLVIKRNIEKYTKYLVSHGYKVVKVSGDQ